MVGLADKSVFIQEVVLQEHFLEICYNSQEKSEYVVILNIEKHLYMSHSE